MALYQKGRFFWNKRRQADHLKAIEYFNQALQLDPNFALAYAGLGDVYTVDSFRAANQAERDETVPLRVKVLRSNRNLPRDTLSSQNWTGTAATRSMPKRTSNGRSNLILIMRPAANGTGEFLAALPTTKRPFGRS